MAWGSWVTMTGYNVWHCTTGWSNEIQFGIQLFWKYRSNLETNQTEIYLDYLRFIEWRQLCLAYQVVTFEGGFPGNTTTGSAVLTQKDGNGATAKTPYFVDVSIGKSQVFNNDKDGKATGLYFSWRCNVSGEDSRVPKMTKLRTVGTDGVQESDGKYGTYLNVDMNGQIPQLLLKSSVSASASSVNLGSTVTINVTRKSTSYTHTVKWSFGGRTGTLCTKSTNTSLSWTPELYLAAEIPNATSGAATITCTTYSGNTNLGSTTCTITLKTTSACYPTIEVFNLVDQNSKCQALGFSVAGQSYFRGEISASGAYGSTVKTVSTTFNGKTYSETPFMTSVIPTSGTKEVQVTITDSRGYSVTKTYYVTIVAYSSPTISNLIVDRCIYDSSAGTYEITDDGKYTFWSFGYATSSLNNQNTRSVNFRILKQGTSSYTSIGTTSLSSATGNHQTVVNYNGFDINQTYYLQLALTDYFETVTATVRLDTSYTLINFGANGESVAFMKASENKGEFECNMPVKHMKGCYAHSFSSMANESGYIHFATVTITSAWASSPLAFKLIHRNAPFPTEFALSFVNANTTDPTVNHFYRNNNACRNVYYHKDDAGVYSLWIQKSENWEHLDILELSLGAYGNTHFDVEFVSEVSTSLPNGSVAATLYS